MAETRLHRAFRSRLTRIQDRTVATALALDTSSTPAYVSRVVPVVLAAQATVVVQTDSYLSSEAGIVTGTSTEPWGLDPDRLTGVHARRGDFLEDVYARNHRAEESTFEQRITRVVLTDLVLAERAATFIHTAGDSRITGYRRVLNAGKNCALCVTAASRDYSKAELRPLHHACRCTTQPIYGSGAGWSKPSKAALNELYEAAGGAGRQQLQKLAVDVEIVDGALGPTLISVAT